MDKIIDAKLGWKQHRAKVFKPVIISTMALSVLGTGSRILHGIIDLSHLMKVAQENNQSVSPRAFVWIVTMSGLCILLTITGVAAFLDNPQPVRLLSGLTPLLVSAIQFYAMFPIWEEVDPFFLTISILPYSLWTFPLGSITIGFFVSPAPDWAIIVPCILNVTVVTLIIIRLSSPFLAFVTFVSFIGLIVVYHDYDWLLMQSYYRRVDHAAERQNLRMLLKMEEKATTEENSMLMRNAMRLAIPQNPVVDSSTGDRIARLLSELDIDPQVLNTISADSAKLVPSRVRLHSNQIGSLYCKLSCVVVNKATFGHCPVITKALVDPGNLPDDFLKELLRIGITATTESPSIPNLTPTLCFSWSPILIMAEQYFGPNACTLHDLALELGTHGLRLDWQLFRPLAICMAEALMELHAKGILHREITSSTTKMLSMNKCVLGSIGFMHCLPEARKLIGIRNGLQVAPEVWGELGNEYYYHHHPRTEDKYESSQTSNSDTLGSGYTKESDVWALCVVCWELLCGTFTTVSPLSVPSTVPPAVAQIILDGVSRVPGQRPTAAELCHVFKRESPMSGGMRDSYVMSKPIFETFVSKIAIEEEDEGGYADAGAVVDVDDDE